MPKLLFDPARHPDLTYEDAFLVPHNSILDRLQSYALGDEMAKLHTLHHESSQARTVALEGIRAGTKDLTLQKSALSVHRAFRDYVLELGAKYPGAVTVTSRDHVDVSPIDGFGNLPIVSANMNTVTGKRMAEAMARMGGSGALPQDMPDSEIERIADYIHSRDTRYPTAISVTPQTSVSEFHRVLQKRDFSAAVVVNQQGQLMGVLQKKDIPEGVNPDAAISDYVSSSNLVTGDEGITPQDAIKRMQEGHVHFLPVLGSDGKVLGAYTEQSAAMQLRYRPYVDADFGGLSVLATVGAVNKDPVGRMKHFISVGVRGIVLDTAHLDQGLIPYRNIQSARDLVEQSGRRIAIIAGNVVTAEATRDALAAGADIVKVGIGPGAACTTRMETGVGRPQLSAVLECAEEAEICGGHIWADGGIKHPRDVALALAAGASQVMIGSDFVPLLESPPELEPDGNRSYKKHAGMASRESATLRRRRALEDDLMQIFRSTVGEREEGVSNARVYQGTERSVAQKIHRIMDGVTSSMTYAGAKNLDEFRRFAHIGVQTNSGFQEGKPRA